MLWRLGLGAAGGFGDEAAHGPAAGDHDIDGVPVGESAEVAVVDVDVGGDLAAGGYASEGGFVGVVGVDGIELKAAFATPIHGLIEEVTFAHGPKDEL